MFLFLKLYLAHLIGDFVLQFEELYQLKVRSHRGHLAHVLMHFLASSILVLPYLKIPGMWLFLIALCTIHLGQDLLKYSASKRYPKWSFVFFTVDQIFHFLMVSTILLFPISQQFRGFGIAGIDFFYLDSYWTLLGIAFFLTTFGTSYFLGSFRKNYITGSRPNHFITSFEIAYGIFEKTLITGIFMFSHNPAVIFFCPVIGLFRIGSKKLNDTFDFFLNFMMAALIGILFRNLI